MIRFSRRVLLSCAVAGLALTTVTGAQAQTYPTKEIRAFLGFAAGTGADIQSRYFADKLAARFGKPVVMENRPGALGNIAAESVAKARPDGYTILFAAGSASMAANVHLFKKLPYDPVKDFVPVSTFVRLPFVLMVAPTTPVKNVAELTEYLKKKGKVNWGSSNTTGLAAGALYMTTTGINAVQVPYRNTPDGLNDLIGNQIDFMFMDALFGLEQARSGRIRALAVTSGERSSVAAEIPTMNESGVAGFDLSPWWAVYVPSGTPQPIVDHLAKAVREIAMTPEAKEFLNRQGAEPYVIDTKAAQEMQARDTEKWGTIARIAKIEPQ